MYLRHHFLSCVILTILLFPFFSYLSFLVFIFGFFIDVDHYIYDAIKSKDLNLKNSYYRHMDKNLERKNQLHIFHTIEFVLLVFIILIYSKSIIISIISLGLILHLLLDFIYHFYLIKNNIEMKQTRSYSLISFLNI